MLSYNATNTNRRWCVEWKMLVGWELMRMNSVGYEMNEEWEVQMCSVEYEEGWWAVRGHDLRKLNNKYMLNIIIEQCLTIDTGVCAWMMVAGCWISPVAGFFHNFFSVFSLQTISWSLQSFTPYKSTNWTTKNLPDQYLLPAADINFRLLDRQLTHNRITKTLICTFH